MNKFETARNVEAEVTPSDNTYPVGALSVVFVRGADWGAAYARERAEKLVKAIKSLHNETDLFYPDDLSDWANQVLNAYAKGE